MHWLFWIVGLIGHLGIWCVVFNRIHATAWPRTSRKVSEKTILLFVAIPLLYVAITAVPWAQLGLDSRFETQIQRFQQYILDFGGRYYATLCLLAGLFFIVRWCYRKWVFRLPTAVVARRTSRYDLRSEISEPLLHGWFAKLLGGLPLNELLQLTTEEMTFSLDIPPELDGLKICQLSDLHFTGQIGIEYFQNIVARVNEFEPDLILVTGDLVDEEKCLPWLESTLGVLQAKHGVFYVLGNHDLRIKNEVQYRNQLAQLGLNRSGGAWQRFRFNGAEIEIAGNELPWFPGAESLPIRSNPAPAALRILLSHSPDQIDWAKPYRFNLIFAGHTHGGQIALPIIGPLVAPSRYGVRYAAGTFQIGDTLMHVSRGLSGDEPIRFCSPPELGLFTIRSSRKLP